MLPTASNNPISTPPSSMEREKKCVYRFCRLHRIEPQIKQTNTLSFSLMTPLSKETGSFYYRNKSYWCMQNKKACQKFTPMYIWICKNCNYMLLDTISISLILFYILVFSLWKLWHLTLVITRCSNI